MDNRFSRALLVRKGRFLLLVSFAIVAVSAATISQLSVSAVSMEGGLGDPPRSAVYTTESVLRLSIKTNEIEFNHLDGLLYATRPSTAGSDGNAVTRIDPLTGNIIGSVYVGSEPTQIAFSDTGETMYTVLEGAYSIRRYDTITQSPGLQFPIGRGQSVNANDAALLSADLEVVPGNPDKVAVARIKPGISPPGSGVAIYENGVALPNISPGHSQSPSSLAFSSSPSILYGGTYDSGLRTLSVDASGVADITINPRYSGTEIKFENGLIFMSNGKVVDSTSNLLRASAAEKIRC